MSKGLLNLEKNGNSVDHIIMHCAPSSIQSLLGFESYGNNVLTDYLEQIKEKCTFKKWFFGHYHDNIEIGDSFMMLYEKIIKIQ